MAMEEEEGEEERIKRANGENEARLKGSMVQWFISRHRTEVLCTHTHTHTNTHTHTHMGQWLNGLLDDIGEVLWMLCLGRPAIGPRCCRGHFTVAMEEEEGEEEREEEEGGGEEEEGDTWKEKKEKKKKKKHHKYQPSDASQSRRYVEAS